MHVRHIELCEDEVDGDGAVLDQLADELDPHVQMLDLVIGLERREDRSG